MYYIECYFSHLYSANAIVILITKLYFLLLSLPLSLYRLKDIFNFIFKHHPSSKSDTNIASMSSVDDELSDNKRLEIINLKGQYSDVSKSSHYY